MKIILSPAKKMIVDTDNLASVELPVYIDKTAEVLNWMKSKSKEELKAMYVMFADGNTMRRRDIQKVVLHLVQSGRIFRKILNVRYVL